MARNSQYRGGSGTNPSVFARGETVSQAPTATMITEVREQKGQVYTFTASNSEINDDTMFGKGIDMIGDNPVVLSNM